MTDPVDALFDRFVADARASGSADPLPYVRRLAGSERQALVERIDGYLEGSRARRFDRSSSPGTTWSSLLPRLRLRVHLTRNALVDRLAEDLGLPERASAVGAYYQAMEQGTLTASGVDDRVLEALGAIVHADPERLREAGAGGAAETRAGGGAGRAAAARADGGGAFEEDEDEVRRLFTGRA